MTRGRWKLTSETEAAEAYALLIRKDRANRKRPKDLILQKLANPETYENFLKLCLEYDDSTQLNDFRAGLLWVIRAIGPEKFSKKSGIHRVSLYRMLSPKGNPRMEGLMCVLKALQINLWIVNREFISRRSRFVRPKDLQPEDVFVKLGRKLR